MNTRNFIKFIGASLLLPIVPPTGTIGKKPVHIVSYNQFLEEVAVMLSHPEQAAFFLRTTFFDADNPFTLKSMARNVQSYLINERGFKIDYSLA